MLDLYAKTMVFSIDKMPQKITSDVIEMNNTTQKTYLSIK